MPTKPYRFEIHPSVVFQLGADLITDDFQALIELVKNSYDADATYAKVTIDTDAPAQQYIPNSFFPQGKGCVVVSDDGNGMDEQAIRDGWLVVSNSQKRTAKKEGRLRKLARIPLGDKGLGRLGSQRLGNNLEIVTVAKGSNVERHVGFRWKDFEDCAKLSTVPISRSESQVRKRSGTTLLISGLFEPKRWNAENKADIESRLAELISPFEGIQKFHVFVTLNGTELELAKFQKKVRREADTTFNLNFDDTTLHITGRTKLRQLKPTGARADVFARICELDTGEQLLEYLQQDPLAKQMKLKKDPSNAWYATFQKAVCLDKLHGVALDDRGKVVSPGTFRGEVDSVSISAERLRQQTAFPSGAAYRDHVKSMAGVYVYRDGFGIRVERDFLQLGKQTTKGRSWYGLRPGNTIGYIAISARNNAQLVETTDREGFRDNPAYRNLVSLLNEFVDFTSMSLEFLRRGTIAFCDSHTRQTSEIEPDATPQTIASAIGRELGRASAAHRKLQKLEEQIAKPAEELDAASEAAKSVLPLSPEIRAVRNALSAVQPAIRKILHGLHEASESIQTLETTSKQFDVLQGEINQFEDRLDRAYDAIALGLTVEALAHELRSLAERLSRRAASIERHLDSTSVNDKKIQAFVSHVRSTVAALRRQLSHLDPALKYARERREPTELHEFLAELSEYHKARWAGKALDIRVDRLRPGSFDVLVNRGKLTQVLDNLILNSEYWLREDLRRKRIDTGQVLIETRPPYLWVSDNGYGIDPTVERTLFQPFVTKKRRGHGLGLFIVRQFLESEGCTIELFAERNEHDRLYAFELDLSGIANE